MTYDEFYEAVQAKLKDLIMTAPEDLIVRFMKEGEPGLKRMYDEAIAQLEAGEITEETLRVGRVASVANCLFYLF